MASANRKQQHAYRVSYALDVGSSFDPDMEDLAEWERDLQGKARPAALNQLSLPLAYLTQRPEMPVHDDDDDDVPAEFDDDAFAAYVAEQELLQGLTPEDVFTYSDIDDVPHIDTDVDEKVELAGSCEPARSNWKGKQRAVDLGDGDVEMGG